MITKSAAILAMDDKFLKLRDDFTTVLDKWIDSYNNFMKESKLKGKHSADLMELFKIYHLREKAIENLSRHKFSIDDVFAVNAYFENTISTEREKVEVKNGK